MAGRLSATALVKGAVEIRKEKRIQMYAQATTPI
jgi:hypothetical protein